MTKIFDRFLRNPADVSIGDDAGLAPSSAPVGPLSPADYAWITGVIETVAGPVPMISTRLGRVDRLGTVLARLSINRMSYSVPPGLYAVGTPDPSSPVFVTGNCKMSFDRLRRALAGRDGWVLVLDTHGINVWCAAGKGTFGTDEIVRRVEAARLSLIVSRRSLILPQLGAPGVAAHEVAQRTKFRVVYGPVRAEDLPAFLDAGSKATHEMRLARFRLKDRIVLVPVELAQIITNKAFLAALAIGVLGLAGVKLFSFSLPAFLGAVLIGTVVVPAFLPWIPGRAFSFKGWLLGFVWTAGLLAVRGLPATASGWLSAAASLLIFPSLSAFIAMNFTGSSPITSLSGVVKEMRTAVPLMILAAILGAAAAVAAAII